MKIVWKNGYSPAGVSAQTAHDVVQKLQDQGKRSPKDLVDASRPEDAPLHSLFEWDDSVAAERFREGQARCIITHIVIEQDESPEPEKPVVRAFFNIDRGSSEFEPLIKIMSDEEKHNALLETAKRELRWFREKYRVLKELDSLFAVIDKLTEE